jgi:hypothetical protein
MVQIKYPADNRVIQFDHQARSATFQDRAI